MEKLEHLKQKEIYQAKMDFFTNVAHEIKTPLTLIKAPLEKVLKNIDDDSKASFHLRIMEKNTEKLIALTNQLLDFRTVEMNSFQLSYASIAINDLVSETFSGFKPLADKKRISAQLIMPEKKVVAEVDPDALQKILNNLMLNAINYCEQKVIIKLSVDQLEENFIIEFINDGQVIPPALSEKIFDPFYRVKNNGHSGNGLGLALSRSLALLHNGTLNLSFPVNELNVFTLVIPKIKK